MEIYLRPQGTCFQHDDPQNDGRFQPSAYYYVTWVELPADYYKCGCWNAIHLGHCWHRI